LTAKGPPGSIVLTPTDRSVCIGVHFSPLGIH
jgi:hypothetical protein